MEVFYCKYCGEWHDGTDLYQESDECIDRCDVCHNVVDNVIDDVVEFLNKKGVEI